MTYPQDTFSIVLIGCGATLLLDIWSMLLKQLGVQGLNLAFVGRWIGHLLHGQVAHRSIGKAKPIPNELALGWLTHYAIGIAFSALLIAICGSAWAKDPTWAPAVLFGISTVMVPLFVMQPAMGLGVAASRTPTPLRNCIRSVLNHAVFGAGLFLSAWVIA
jgi:uncharacterized membrane protein (UPF0136 family)